jgi:hypothetical protein
VVTRINVYRNYGRNRRTEVVTPVKTHFSLQYAMVKATTTLSAVIENILHTALKQQ